MKPGRPENGNAPADATAEARKTKPLNKDFAVNTSMPVPFYGNTLYLVEHNGEAYTPMKPIVDGMGLDWAAQFTKVKQRFASSVAEIAMVAEDGKPRKMTCLALRKLAAWLYSISPNKVRPELRDKVISYQAECDDVLWNYWTKGQAINPRYRHEATREMHRLGLTREQQDIIKAHHKALVALVPKERQAKLSIGLWSAIKAKFGVSYKDVPESDFGDVLSLMSRVAVEGDWLPASSNMPSALHVSESDASNLHALFCAAREAARNWKMMDHVLRAMQSPMCGEAYDCHSRLTLGLGVLRKLADQASQQYHKRHPVR